MQNLIVIKFDENKRLDVFLTDKLDLSRSQIQKIIKEGEVLVNGKKESAHYKTREGDIVKIKALENKKIKINANLVLPKFDIIEVADDYLVINKPAGVIVHGGTGIKELTLVDALIKKYPKIKKVGDDPARPGIVHRLDKEASGLMVIAKNNKSFESLKKQFQERITLKKYFALVHGKIKKEIDEINFPINRSAKGYKMASKPKNQEGRNAITEFAIKQKFINFSLLDVKIKTGRTHQIRAHMSAYGHPIVGDDLYGTKKTREKNAKLNLDRIFLHAHTLGFYNLIGEWQEFKIEMPKKLKELLNNIK